MFNIRTAFTALLGAAALSTVAAIPTISAVGSKFFTSDGNQWFIKGIAYQLVESDPLIDTNQCKLDAALMQKLGANSIRVYHVDPKANHDGCMQAFASAGIYLFVDLDTFNTVILGPAPAFNDTQFQYFTAVLDTFQQYDNLAGVFIGNEVLTTPNDSQAAPYVKAAAMNVKAYRNRMKYRSIPVGYAAADISSLRPMLQNYLVCGNNASAAIDFFSLNAYEWCGGADYSTSGYINLQSMSADYPAPIFFSETGCNTSPPRTFGDQSAIFGQNMSSTWSGAIIYEWIEEDNNYGLINYGSASPGQYQKSGTPTPMQPDFTNLQSQWATLKPSGVKLSDYSASAASLSTPACPSSTSGVWHVNGNPPLPTVGESYNPTSVPSGQSFTAGPSATNAPGASGGASAAAATATKGAASGGKEVAGMSVGLLSVMMGFVMWS